MIELEPAAVELPMAVGPFAFDEQKAIVELASLVAVGLISGTVQW